jgi:cell division protease FtsH
VAELTREEATGLVTALRDLVDMVDRALPRQSGLIERVRGHLGVGDDADQLPNTTASFPSVERANLQLALDALRHDAAVWEELGLTPDIGNYGGVSLVAMVAGTWHGPGVTGRQYVEAAVDVEETIDCLAAGVVLTRFEDVPVALLLYASDQGMTSVVVVEAVAAAAEVPHRFLTTLRDLMDQRNVMRGKVMAFAFGRHGDFGIRFARLPGVTRDEVVLDEAVLAAIERHALGITGNVDALRASGQHVRRGLLLFGPPGTGKTHTVSYLLNAMPGRTGFILSGAAVAAVGQAGTLARSLQPATIVIEDVDLVAMDRDLPGGSHNSLLFQLLTEMDGLAGDADVLFVLTTNRADLLEPALAARPGRVDQAIELPLPDAEARHRLLDLYLPGEAATAEVPPDALQRVLDRTDGVAAAFIKELARRASLGRIVDGATLSHHLEAGLDEMIDRAAPILRSSLATGGRHQADARGSDAAPS